jgi:Trypsin-like peptidase domain
MAMTKPLPSPSCVVKVGDGRGFLIEHRQKLPRMKSTYRKGSLKPVDFVKRRLVITAAHCLPRLPPAPAASLTEDRTYCNLLASLESAKTSVWAECLFVDPIADIAILGCPDDQLLEEEADAYDELTDNAAVLRIGDVRSGRGWVLSLDGRWVRTNLELASGGALLIDPTVGGMSGSPILNDVGRSVGVVVIGTENISPSGERTNMKAGPQPRLTHHLPGWLLLSQ